MNIKSILIALVASTNLANAIVVFDSPFPEYVKGASLTHQASEVDASCQIPGIEPDLAISINTKDWQNSRKCGACIRVTNPENGNSAIGTLTGECPECEEGGLLVSSTLYSQIASPDSPSTTVDWTEVPCSSTPGSLNLRWSPGSDQYKSSIQFFGSTYAIARVHVQNVNTKVWKILHRNAQNWFPLRPHSRGPFVFRVTYRDGGISFTEPIQIGENFEETGLLLTSYIPFSETDEVQKTVQVPTNGNCVSGPCLAGVANATDVEVGDVDLSRRNEESEQEMLTRREESGGEDEVVILDGEEYPPVEIFDPQTLDNNVPLSKRQTDSTSETPECFIGFTLKSRWIDQITANHSIQLTALTDVPHGWYLSLSLTGRGAHVRAYTPSKLPLLEGTLGPEAENGFYQLHSAEGVKSVEAGHHLVNVRLTSVHPYGKPEEGEAVNIVASCDDGLK
ncbi:hypothetical protein HDV05_001116 [Chytridiales sp. JEL 0842]|nr:hypothetical protein HDV05_001116 [Chytridiales sp. JEL 0842]